MKSVDSLSRRGALVLGLALSQTLAWHSAFSLAGSNDLPVFGYLENALIQPQAFPIRAKLDTGADNSSAHATMFERFERDGKPWIAFTVESIDGRELRMEKPVVRTARIKRHSGKPQLRSVVSMRVCVGNISREVQVNLVDRSKLKYNLLVGRSFMSGHLLVDPSKQFTSEPHCTGNDPK